MLRDMTIGQFYPAESVIHRLDPRVKVVGVLAYLISLFLFRGFVGYAVVTVFLGTVIVLSKVPLRYIVRGMKPILFLLIVTALFNLFGTSGDVVFHWKFITITWQGIRNAQSARGADFEEGRLWQRMRAMVSILVPLLVSATRRAYELANAMEARCYHGGEGRTKMKPLKYRAVDRISYGVLLGYLVCVIGITHFIPW